MSFALIRTFSILFIILFYIIFIFFNIFNFILILFYFYFIFIFYFIFVSLKCLRIIHKKLPISAVFLEVWLLEPMCLQILCRKLKRILLLLVANLRLLLTIL